MKKKITIILSSVVYLSISAALSGCNETGGECGPFTFDTPIETLGKIREVRVIEKTDPRERSFICYAIFDYENNESDIVGISVRQNVGEYPEHREMIVLNIPAVILSGEVGNTVLTVDEKMTIRYMDKEYRVDVKVEGSILDRYPTRCSPVEAHDRFAFTMKVGFTLPAVSEEDEPKEIELEIGDKRYY